MCNDITFEQKLYQQARHVYGGNDGCYFSYPEADFSNCNLRGRDFSGQDLRNVNFSGADLEGAIFDRAVLKSNQMLYANLNRCSFRSTKIVGVAFIRACIKNCIFTGAEINHSTFEYADFTGTNLDDAILLYCNTTNAILDGTHQTPVPAPVPVRGRTLTNVYIDDANVFDRIGVVNNPDPTSMIGMSNPLYESTIMGIMERRSSEAIRQEYDREMFREYERSITADYIPDFDIVGAPLHRRR